VPLNKFTKKARNGEGAAACVSAIPLFGFQKDRTHVLAGSMALCRRCSSVFGIGLTTYSSRFVHSGLQRSATLRLKSEIGLSGGRTIMSRYYDGPVPIKERKPKPVQQKTAIGEPEPQMAGMATSQLATSAGTQDSLAKAPTSSTSDALESRETLQSVLEGPFFVWCCGLYHRLYFSP
jgi:hypothetical protein